MRAAAILAARRASWTDILARFESRLVETLHAPQTPPAHVALVA